ncbi:MAG: hypothetical protein ACXVRJ_02260 [Gaiellaceae bacterium]
MTTAIATTDLRRVRQQRITALLDELEQRRRHLYRLKDRGARRAGVRDLRSELETTRRRLLDTVGGA